VVCAVAVLVCTSTVPYANQHTAALLLNILLFDCSNESRMAPQFSAVMAAAYSDSECS
jgi:hypothetical protein